MHYGCVDPNEVSRMAGIGLGNQESLHHLYLYPSASPLTPKKPKGAFKATISCLST